MSTKSIYTESISRIGNFQKRRPEFELPKNQALLETGGILENLKTGMPIRKKPILRNTIDIDWKKQALFID